MDNNDVSQNPDAREAERVHRALAIGEVSYVLTKKDDPTVTVVKKDRIYGSTDHSAASYGELLTNGNLDGIPVPAGVVSIFGGANSGKSPLASYIANKLGGKMVRYGEPLPGYFRDVSQAVHAILSADEQVVVLDSTKNLVGRIDGGLMASGVSREFFAMLSDWSSYFAELGQTVIVVVNATVKDASLVQMVVEGLYSNTTGIIHAADSTLTWAMRAGSGKQRSEGTSKIIWAGDGKIQRLQMFGTPKNGAIRESARVIPDADSGVTDVTSAFNRAMSRLVRRAPN